MQCMNALAEGMEIDYFGFREAGILRLSGATECSFSVTKSGITVCNFDDTDTGLHTVVRDCLRENTSR